MLFLLTIWIVVVPQVILTNNIPSPVLSAISSPVAVDDITDTSPNSTTTPLAVSPEGDHDLIIPPVVPVVATPGSFNVTSVDLTHSTSGTTQEGSSDDVTTTIRLKNASILVTNSNYPNLQRASNKSLSPENKFNKSVSMETMTSKPFSPYRNISDSWENSTVTSEDNSTLPAGFAFLSGMIRIIGYIRENPDRALVVVLGSVCVCLFITVLFLACRCDSRIVTSKQPECTSLIAASQRSQAEFSSTADGAQHPDGYINQIQNRHHRRKKRTRTQTLLNQWCTCCCTNAPWQRDHSDSEDSYHIAPRSTSLSDDDVISADPGRHQLNEIITAFPSSMQQEAERRATSVEPSGLDNTSEYEFQDEMAPTSDPPLRPSTSHDFSTTLRNEEQRIFAEGVFSAPLRTNFQRATVRQTYEHPRETPPFPKPITYNYPLQPSPYVNNPRGYQQPRNNYPVEERPQQAYIPNGNEHYVALRPHQQLHNERHFDLRQAEARLQRRDSIYDNSLPRDSPIYEYYQRQLGRQELPGTRNINHYYS